MIDKKRKAIVISNLCKQYGSIKALTDMSITLYENSIMVVWGPNGAGKTTFLKMISGLLPKDGGSITFPSKPSTKKSKRILGYQSEVNSFWPNLSSAEQCRLMQQLYGIQDNNRVNELLDYFGLSKYKDHHAKTLSNGNKRKLSFVLSVLHNPAYLVLDEPFAALDGHARKELCNWLKDFALTPGHALIFSSHLFDEVKQLADQLAILHQGKLLKLLSENIMETELLNKYEELLQTNDI